MINSSVLPSVWVTGANGFVGLNLCKYLYSIGFRVIPVIRADSIKRFSLTHFTPVSLESLLSGDECCGKNDVVVHCAARVHVMDDVALDPLIEFRAVNTDITLSLAEKAADAGVKRFIFISSIKVNGEFTEPGSSFNADSACSPIDPYGLSKYEAEVGLQGIAKKHGLEVVIIRPPLVYGPGVKGNFSTMMKWLNKGLPLPLGAVKNKRSFVYIGNLIDLIVTCVSHANAANQTFLVSDDDDVSTTALLNMLAVPFDSSVKLLPVPSPFLESLARLLGKKTIAQRLLGSLQVDISKTKSYLDWTPPYKVNEGLKTTAQYYLNK